MKNIIFNLSTLLLISLIVTSIPTVGLAHSVSSQEFEYLEDGSYFTSITYDLPEQILPANTSKVKTGSRVTTYYSSTHKKLWSITVHGKFTYNGTSAKCTECTASKEVFNNNWKVTITSKNKSGNCASTTGKGTLYTNGTISKTVSKTVSLRCKPNGTLY